MGLIHSWARNCGKSIILYLLSKLQGLATRQHPLSLSSTSGTSASVSSYHILKSSHNVCTIHACNYYEIMNKTLAFKVGFYLKAVFPSRNLGLKRISLSSMRHTCNDALTQLHTILIIIVRKSFLISFVGGSLEYHE